MILGRDWLDGSEGRERKGEGLVDMGDGTNGVKMWKKAWLGVVNTLYASECCRCLANLSSPSLRCMDTKEWNMKQWK